MRGFLLFLLPTLRHGFFLWENREHMSPEPKKTRTTKPRPQVGQVIRRLLAAVDRSITAADEAREARDQLVRLAGKEQAGQ